MGRSEIVNGIWIRNIPKKWQKPGCVGRTDIFKSVLEDLRLKIIEYRFEGGPIVRIPKEELQKVIDGGTDHYSDKIWGPFNINYQTLTVNGIRVEMEVL